MKSCLPRVLKNPPNLKANNMKTMMRNAVMVLMMGLFAMPTAAYELPKPKLIAVFFSASWCSSCKILGPELDTARQQADLDKKDILFVKLDLSDKASIHQSILLSSALGIAPFVQKQGSSTGYVALLAADKTTELTRFDRSSKAQDISTMIEKNLKQLDEK